MNKIKLSKAICIILTLGIIASVLISFSTNTFAATSFPVVKVSYKGPAVTALQYLLKEHGYNLSVDGSFGPQTEGIVEDFQDDNDLGVDGIVGSNTWGKLIMSLKTGSTNTEAVKAIQYLLSTNHGYKITVDGSFGPQTKRAVADFQTKSKITSDGTVGTETWQYLLGTIDGDIATSRLVDIAYQELEKGFTETNSNNITPYGEWYGLNGSEWCAMFVSWCANESGLLGIVVPRYSYCPTGADWYESKGKYMANDSGYLPKSGDTIFFYRESKGRIGHTGIVVAYDNNAETVYTIEGNADDAVRLRQYSADDITIDGYGVNGGTSFGDIPAGATDGSTGSIE